MPKDIVILLLGETGAGKSSFVNEAGGHPRAFVSHELEACTSSVQAHRITRQKHNILLIDTPGFNQTKQLDPSIMRQIQAYVDGLNSKTVCFGAVLVFIPLNEPRQAGIKKIEAANTKVLSQLAEDRAAIVTVDGNDVSGGTAGDREAAFRIAFTSPQSVINRRFDFTTESAVSILDEVLKKGTVDLQVLKDAIQAAHGISTPQKSSKPEHRLGSLLKWLLRR